jgi:hypothetical protein
VPIPGLLGRFIAAFAVSTAAAKLGTPVVCTFGLAIAGGVSGSTNGLVGVMVLGVPLSCFSTTESFGKDVSILSPRPFGEGADTGVVVGCIVAVDAAVLRIVRAEGAGELFGPCIIVSLGAL